MISTLEHEQGQWFMVTEYRLDREPQTLRTFYAITCQDYDTRLDSAEGKDMRRMLPGIYHCANGVRVGVADAPHHTEVLPIAKPRGKGWIYRHGDWIKTR